MKTHYILTAALMFSRCDAVHAAATPLTCPPTITVAQTISEPVPGWESVASNRLLAPHLINVEIYADHPSKAGALVPDQTSRTNQAELATWNFPPDDGTPYWMACVYADTRVLLVRQIPRQTRQCKLTTNLLRQKRNGIAAFTCS